MLYIKDINNNFLSTGNKVIAIVTNKIYKGVVLEICRHKVYVRIEVNVADRINKSEKYRFVYINHNKVMKDVFEEKNNE